MKLKTYLYLLLLTICAAHAATTTASAQKQDPADGKTTAAGVNALRQSDFDSVAEFYQWLFGAEFSPGERRRFQTLTLDYARASESNARAVSEIAQGYGRVRNAGAEMREAARRELLPEIIAAMEKDEADEMNAFLLGIYRRGGAQNPKGGTEDADDKPADKMPGAVKAADLAGLWSTSSVSGERYKSLITGELSDPSGTIIEYQISPNGTVKHVGYLSVTNYTCTSKLFISRTGRVSVSGSQMTFDFAPGKRMYQACGASSRRNDTLPAERETFSFNLERDQYGLQLCTVDAEGRNLCFRKKAD